MAKGEGGFEFFGREWRADIELQSCSLAARGLWAQLLTVMDVATPRGFLLVNGVKPEIWQVAQLGNCKEAEARRCVAELLHLGAASVTADGVIFNRRMAEEGLRSEKARRSVATRYGGATDGGTEPATNTPTKGVTNHPTKGVTNSPTNSPTNGATNPPSPLHPPSPSDSLLESSSSASNSLRKRLRARGSKRGCLQENQAVSSLRQAGYSVENGAGNGGENGAESGLETGLKIGAKTVKKANPDFADQRLHKHLTQHEGKTDGEAWALLMAAYDPAHPDHHEAAELCERISRLHGYGWYRDRRPPSTARHGVRA